jgi:uncharacterized protein
LGVLIGILFVISLIVEYYCYQAIKVLTNNKLFRQCWLFFSISALLIILIWSLLIDRNNKTQVHFLLGFFTIIFIPKFILAITIIFEDLIRMLTFLFRKASLKSSVNKTYLPERRKAISTIGLGLASVPFFSIIEGIVWGKFDFRVRKVILKFPDLPENFDGYKIAQLSDIHLGSFSIQDFDKIARGIKLLNDQNADLFVFTGDSVNNLAEEMEPWLPLLKIIKAKDGKYSILGNHDYGVYIFGNNKIAQQKNIDLLNQYHKSINWELLRNESIRLYKDNQFINIVGVKNWGVGHYPKDGDLAVASQNIKDGEFNILLSHDPSHFDAIVKNFTKKMHLTLSGHTHGMQFGIEIPGVIKWSPIKYRYPKWADLYQENGKYLYVNRGFGFIGFPGRVGIWPEITVIELKKG